MGKINAKAKGNAFELWCIKRMKHIFPDAVSARWESKRLDDLGVDICYTDSYSFQCKAVEGSMDVFKVLDGMPNGPNMNVVLWKRNRKGVFAVFRAPRPDFCESYYNWTEVESKVNPIFRGDKDRPFKWKHPIKGTVGVMPLDDFICIIEKNKGL